MSVDIDWSLLSTVTTGESLSSTLVALLNKQLSSTTLPSFLGAIKVTEFDFGTIGPDVEIKDVGDVWRAFEDDDNEDSEGEEDVRGGGETGMMMGGGGEHENGYPNGRGHKHGKDMGGYSGGVMSDGGSGMGLSMDETNAGHPMGKRPRKKSQRRNLAEERDLETHSRHQQNHDHGQQRVGEREGEGDEDETGSVMSGFSGILSPRISLNRLGAGIGLGSGMGVQLHGSLGGGVGGGGGLGGSGASGIGIGLTAAASGIMGSAMRNPSLYSVPMSHPRVGGWAGGGAVGAISKPGYNKRNSLDPTRRLRPVVTEDDRAFSRGQTPPLTPGEESPYIPLDEAPPQPLPSIQILLHLAHNPNIHLTLLTSLQINYPSPLFMALPLKLSITGFTLSADIVLAFNGPKRRLHLCLVDEFDSATPFSHSPGLSAPSSTSGLQSPESSSAPHTPGVNSPFGIGMGMRGFTPVTPGLSGGPSSAGGFYSNSRGGDEGLRPIGERILPNIQIESEIGHSDVHVLRNVGKVEKFIADVLRKALVDELLWPNYQTVAL